MTFRAAIGLYLRDAQADGRLASRESVRSYLSRLERLAEQVGNRDPRTVGKDDINRCLATWPNMSTKAHARSIFVAFFDWCEQEDHTPGNPARKTRRPRVKKSVRYRLTLDETTAVVAAAHGVRERRAIYLHAFAGLRNAELRGLRGRHLQRPGFIWVSKDIGKGGRERWIPVLTELAPVIDEIRAHVATDEYVLPSEKKSTENLARVQSGERALCNLVRRVMQRAGIAAAFDSDSRVGPHTLRHAFTDHVQRMTSDVRIAQALLGHASIATTQGYLSVPTLDELSKALGMLPPAKPAVMPDDDVAEREPPISAFLAAEPNVAKWLRELEPTIGVYEEAFA